MPGPTDHHSADPSDCTRHQLRQDRPSEQPTAEQTRWYVESLFGYTNQLMERMQVRCNYLILANSVAVVTFFTIMNALLTNRGDADYLVSPREALLFALLPAALFLTSLITAVTAFLPRIYEHQIELNHRFIASIPADAYGELVSSKPDCAKLNDFIEEIHVLSRILNDRTKRVDLTARLFICATVAMIIVIGVTVI